MSDKLRINVIVAAFGGFLIGLNIAGLLVIKPLLIEYFQISGAIESLIIFSGVPGFLFGIIAIGRLADKYGRRFMLKVLGFLFLISALGNGLAVNSTMFIIFQIILGLAVGGTSVLSPLYISEISPANFKIRFISLFLLLSVIGMLLGLSISFIMTVDLNICRWIFLGGALPALLFTLSLYFVVRTPYWLVSIGLHGEAYLVLSELNPKLNGEAIDKLVNEIDDSIK